MEAQYYAGGSSPRGLGYVRHFDQDGLIDWTFTFNRHSDFHDSFAGWVLKHSELDPAVPAPPNQTARNYAKGKTKLVLWLVSNCGMGRMDAWKAFTRYLPSDRVKMIGRCSKDRGTCSRGDSSCWVNEMKKYKFYYSAENSRCEGYITEKFERGILSEMVPIAFGGLGRADYAAIMPGSGFIHVDDYASPRGLAEHLLKLDRDDDAYNRYMSWRHEGYMIMTKPLRSWKPFCDLCKQLHLPEKRQLPRRRLGSIPQWWFDKKRCMKNQAAW